jgi:hypothetical protein
MEMAYPPFEMRGTDNQPDGISVRMAEDLAARLKPAGLLADLRGMWRDRVLADDVKRWAL